MNMENLPFSHKPNSKNYLTPDKSQKISKKTNNEHGKPAFFS